MSSVCCQWTVRTTVTHTKLSVLNMAIIDWKKKESWFHLLYKWFRNINHLASFNVLFLTPMLKSQQKIFAGITIYGYIVVFLKNMNNLTSKYIFNLFSRLKKIQNLYDSVILSYISCHLHTSLTYSIHLIAWSISFGSQTSRRLFL